jgi:Dolichyl-phosphate-mannose-protein mannosyltransferase
MGMSIASTSKLPSAHRRVGDRLEAWAARLDRHRLGIAVLLLAIYVALVAPSVRRHLWFDELHTVYIAQATSIRQFIDEIRLLDLNPPLTYLLVRVSMKIFGATEVGARMPIILGYFAGSMAFFLFASRRVGALWAATGVGLFWYSQGFYFATEARPYAVLLGCFGIMLLCWDHATQTVGSVRMRRWWLAGLVAGEIGMLLSHVYAPLWIALFFAAEAMWSYQKRHIDWSLWAALILPMTVCVSYLPLIDNVSQGVFPPEFQGSFSKASWFYVRALFQIMPPLLVGGLTAFAIAAWRRKTGAESELSASDTNRIPAPELVLLLCSLAPPAVLNAIAVREHIAFYDRHAFLTTFTVVILLLLFIAYESRANRLSGLAAAVITLGFTVFLPARNLVPHAAASDPAILRTDFERVLPDLPFVTNSVFTYLEMDHYEGEAFVKRLYYLADPGLSIKYKQSNLTEGVPLMKQYFPIRANVSSYAEFVKTHRHFLVWGEMDFNGWLLHKLKDDGARLIEIGNFKTAYLDSKLYEVHLDR